jgi:hypothetical protein
MMARSMTAQAKCETTRLDRETADDLRPPADFFQGPLQQILRSEPLFPSERTNEVDPERQDVLGEHATAE